MRPPGTPDRSDQLTGFEAALRLIETRFADMREWQSRVFAEKVVTPH